MNKRSGDPVGGARPARLVRCPTCGQQAVFAPENRWRPFCSERCRGVDLGAWASERYRVGAAQPDPDDVGGSSAS